MKKLLLLTLILMASATGARAQVAGTRQSSPFFPNGYCQLTSLAAATQISTCSGGIPQRTVMAVICIETAGVRYRDDGTAPTAAIGQPITAGQCLQYNGTLATLQFIAQSGSPVLNVLFYR